METFFIHTLLLKHFSDFDSEGNPSKISVRAIPFGSWEEAVEELKTRYNTFHKTYSNADIEIDELNISNNYEGNMSASFRIYADNQRFYGEILIDDVQLNIEK